MTQDIQRLPKYNEDDYLNFNYEIYGEDENGDDEHICCFCIRWYEGREDAWVETFDQYDLTDEDEAMILNDYINTKETE